MSYREVFRAAWQEGGPKHALEFLRDVFHHPDNQRVKGKPTDYLNERMEGKLTPVQGFDMIVENFQPTEAIDDRVQFIVDRLKSSGKEEFDQHRAQPFNALLIKVSTYDWGDAVLGSVHFDPESLTCKPQFDLEHDFISPNDSCIPEEKGGFTFIYDLTHGDEYSLSWQEERIAGELLFRHIKLAQFSIYITELIDALFLDDEFANFPKALPFYKLVAEEEYFRDEILSRQWNCSAPIEDFEGHPLQEAHEQSSKPVAPLSPIEQWTYLMSFVIQPGSTEFKQLLELINIHDDLADLSEQFAGFILAQTGAETARVDFDFDSKGELYTSLERILNSEIEWPEKFQDAVLLDALNQLDLGAEDYINEEQVNSEEAVKFILKKAGEHDGLIKKAYPLDLVKVVRRTEVSNWSKEKQIRPWHLSSLFWALEAHRHPIAENYTAKCFSLPLVDMPHKDIEQAMSLGKISVNMVFEIWDGIPQELDKVWKEKFEDNRKAVLEHAHPILRLLAMEAEIFAKTGEEAVADRKYGSPVVYMKEVSDAYLRTLSDCIDEMPDKHNSWAEPFSFVMGRIDGLGHLAKNITDDVLLLMSKYCQEGVYDRGRLIEHFANVLKKMGLDEPTKLIRDHAEKETINTIENYETWAGKARDQAWEKFDKSISEYSESFLLPESWENVLYDSKKGMELFVEKISEHPEQQTILNALASAINIGLGTLLRQLVETFIAKDGETWLSEEDAARASRIVMLITALNDPSEEQLSLLRRCKILQLIWELDKGEGQVQLKAMLSEYPHHSLLQFLEVREVLRAEGAKPAGKLLADRWSEPDDPVFCKAIKQYTQSESPSSLSDAKAYLLFRWADIYVTKAYYEDGKLSCSFYDVDRDPFYRGVSEVASKKSKSDRLVDLKDAELELSLSDKLASMPLEEMSELLDPDHWGLCWNIAQKLLVDVNQHKESLVKLYEWFRGDDDKRKQLLGLLWPHQELRIALLQNDSFVEDLPRFIERFNAIANAKEVFALLNNMQRYSVVLKTAESLSPQTNTGCFLSINQAIQNLGNFEWGIRLLESMLTDETRDEYWDDEDEDAPLKPEFVLIKNNIAVLYIHMNKIEEAEVIYNEIFSMDWSCFEYEKSKNDFMDEVLGGNMDERIANIWRQYYASAKYNAACLYALTGRVTKAVSSMSEARQYSREDYSAAKFEAESDFNSIRDKEEYQEFINSIKEANDE